MFGPQKGRVDLTIADIETTVVNRYCLGAGRGEREQVGPDPVSYLMRQLDQSPVVFGPNLPNSADAITAFRDFRKQRRKARRKKKKMKVANVGRQLYNAEVRARLKTFVDTSTPFAERLCLFWSNHFAISAIAAPIASVAGAFEREAIRPHIGGNFADMVLASSQNPAMLLYLDNAKSIGPTSKVGRRKQRGLNENLARELLELHTLGVNGGYSQDDIQQLALAITGWSVAGPKARQVKSGSFVFRRRAHEPGERTVLGKTYRHTGSAEQGRRILVDMANHPSTARHIAFKLARHFIADSPPKDLLKEMEQAFLDNHGELLPVYETMLRHPTAFDPKPGKFKTPIEFVASVARGLQIDRNYRFWIRGLTVMGQKFWAPPSPKGWPDTDDKWMSSNTLKTRLDFSVAASRKIPNGVDVPELARIMLGSRLSDETSLSVRRAADQSQAITLMLMSPEFQRR